MIRLAGFLVGSAVAVAVILLVLGVPQWQPDEPTPPPVNEAPGVLDAPPPRAVAAPVDQAPQAAAPPPPIVEEPVPVAPGAQPTHWHAFWSPFGSRIAADGFVSRLEAVTGFDYRVVKIDNGVYEVAFAYSDEADVAARLAAIAAATGLELPDS